METDCVLTVAILTFNRKEYLREALDAVLAQTYQNFRVLVLDNASTDGTDLLISVYRDPRVSYVRHPYNLGAAGNFNYALTACQTPFLQVTHDDDRMKPEMLRREVEVLTQYPDVNLVSCDVDHIDASGGVVISGYYRQSYQISDLHFQERTQFFTDYTNGRNLVCCPTVMLRVSAARQSGLAWKADAGPARDTLYWIELNLRQGRFAIIGESLYSYRVHTGQDSMNSALGAQVALRGSVATALVNEARPDLLRRWWPFIDSLIVPSLLSAEKHRQIASIERLHSDAEALGTSGSRTLRVLVRAFRASPTLGRALVCAFRVYNGLKRRQKSLTKPKALRARRSSDPYLSGDTFRCMSHHAVGDVEDGPFDPRTVLSGQVVFCKTDFLHEFATKYLNSISEPFVLLTGNSDINVTFDTEDVLSGPVQAWYAQNLLADLGPRVRPLPIGLENRHYDRNGRVEDFRRLRRFSRRRKFLIAYGFNVATNPVERAEALRCLGSSHLGVPILSSTPEKYRRQVRHFAFVASPPGNGHDCHRTWEAFYLGVIPILVDSLLSRWLHDHDFPVLVVQTWAELEHMTEDYLKREFYRLMPKFQNPMLWSTYWRAELGLEKS